MRTGERARQRRAGGRAPLPASDRQRPRRDTAAGDPVRKPASMPRPIRADRKARSMSATVAPPPLLSDQQGLVNVVEFDDIGARGQHAGRGDRGRISRCRDYASAAAAGTRRSRYPRGCASRTPQDRCVRRAGRRRRAAERCERTAESFDEPRVRAGRSTPRCRAARCSPALRDGRRCDCWTVAGMCGATIQGLAMILPASPSPACGIPAPRCRRRASASSASCRACRSARRPCRGR